jgi:hypothetical protein
MCETSSHALHPKPHSAVRDRQLPVARPIKTSMSWWDRKVQIKTTESYLSTFSVAWVSQVQILSPETSPRSYRFDVHKWERIGEILWWVYFAGTKKAWMSISSV